MSKKIVFIGSAIGAMLLSSVAFATPGNNGGGNGGCGVGQTTNGCGTPAPVYNGGNGGHSTAIQGQAQGQIQGQAQGQSQSVRNSVRNTNLNANVNANRNSNRNANVNANRNNNVAYGGAGGSASSRSSARSYNAGNHQSTSYYESRDRLQAPGVYGNFSSGATAPCEGTPFGIGGSMPGYGGLLQIPRSVDRCWGERGAEILFAQGCRNAGLAVLAGNSVAVALQNNGCEGTPRRRVIRAKN